MSVSEINQDIKDVQALLKELKLSSKGALRESVEKVEDTICSDYFNSISEIYLCFQTIFDDQIDNPVNAKKSSTIAGEEGTSNADSKNPLKEELSSEDVVKKIVKKNRSFSDESKSVEVNTAAAKIVADAAVSSFAVVCRTQYTGDRKRSVQVYKPSRRDIREQMYKEVLRQRELGHPAQDLTPEELQECVNKKFELIGLGLKVIGGRDLGLPLIVTGVRRGGIADLCGGFRIGDELLEMNGEGLHEMNADDLGTLAKNSEGQLVFTVRNNTNLLEMVVEYEQEMQEQQEADDQVSGGKGPWRRFRRRSSSEGGGDDSTSSVGSSVSSLLHKMRQAGMTSAGRRTSVGKNSSNPGIIAEESVEDVGGKQNDNNDGIMKEVAGKDPVVP
eukprot:Nk52_evm19s226 gene=Nk52_evmTU19s226